MSLTVARFPIVAALLRAEEVLGRNLAWRSANFCQTDFLASDFQPCRGEISQIKEIESIVSRFAAEINRFLADKGFAIHVDEFASNEFGTASVLDLMVEWINAGKISRIYTQDRRVFPAVEIGGDGFSVFQSHSLKNHIASLRTRSGDRVCLKFPEHAPPRQITEQFLLDEYEMVHRATLYDVGNLGYESVVFPMVDLNREENIQWLIGLSTTDNSGLPWVVSSALQQTKLRINEMGARAQSAVAITMRCLCVPQRLVFDRPFLFWIERDGLSRPFILAYITEDDWKDPGRDIFSGK